MHSCVDIVAVAGRRPRIAHRGGLAARLTGVDTVHLISAAATPLGGDTVEVRVRVEAGARLTLRSVAATVVLPSATQRGSHSRFDAEVAGELDADVAPIIVAADAHHCSVVSVRIADGARVRVAERAQIGRHGETGGFFTGTLHADAGPAPLLRHRVELGAGAVGADAVFSPAAMISELRYGTPAPPEGAATVLALAGGGWLTTWQGHRLPPTAPG